MKHISLSGSWNLTALSADELPEALSSAKNGPLFTGLTQTIPGDVHTTLLENSIIPNPYWKKNELDVQWVGRTDWCMERTINVPASFLQGEQFISLDGADTFVRVFINGTEAGLCDNFFRAWRFPVTGLLHEGENSIRLVFESSEKHAVARAASLPYAYPCSVYDVSSPNRNLVRKPQCHAGWDWGICLMVSGVYNSIELQQTATGFVDYIRTNLERNGDEWTVRTTTTFTAVRNGNVTFKTTLADLLPEAATTTAAVRKGENTIEQSFTVKNPELWWPAWSDPETEAAVAAGKEALPAENKLYALTVSAGGSSKTVNIAFRELEIEAKEDSYGKSFVIKVNGRAIYAKGSNWIPCDALPSRQTQAHYENLLSSLVKANGNLIRVWGGGFYEIDFFYDYCDRHGILVWQDCMFGCSTYPADDEFLKSVRLEIRHQVRRLEHHACIALWCGNNEDLGALTWYEESKNSRDRYVIDYDRLNEQTVGDEIKKNDPERCWWPSSPSAGPNDFSDNWHADGRGDMHYWVVWHEKKPFEAYYDITPRFVSEFGYQSLPDFGETASFTDSSQWNITSPDMEFHQRSPGGNSIIFENFARYFRVPGTFQHTLYLSQVQQALAIQTAVTYWRSLKPVCWGSVIWQLDNLWPVASWSSLEYSGKWKLLHYSMRHFFAPVAAFLFKKNDTVFCYLLNDTASTVPVKLTVSYYDFAGNKAADSITLETKLAPDSSTKACELPCYALPVKADSAFMYATLEWGAGSRSESTLFLTEPKRCALQKAGISYEVAETADGFDITLSSEAPAFYTQLDAGTIPGVFSENFLTLLPGEKRTVHFAWEKREDWTTAGLPDTRKVTPRKPSLTSFKKALSVQCLNDLW
ncbi:MAG: glycoside hydrolase family 2 protein [Treponema sp.]|nr:glycoside hydrolase family 2 protein [Candidatus Treponema caballi]